jgi:hypothetical protein
MGMSPRIHGAIVGVAAVVLAAGVLVVQPFEPDVACVGQSAGQEIPCTNAAAVPPEEFEEEHGSPPPAVQTSANIYTAIGIAGAGILAAGLMATGIVNPKRREGEPTGQRPPASPPQPATSPGAAAVPSVAAGWYPDPKQPGTQRYWDGSTWTEQTAPLASSGPLAGMRTITLGLGLIGAVLAMVGVFLPQVESSEFLRVAENTMVQSGPGIIVIALALGALAALYRKRVRRGITVPAIALGGLIIALAIYSGTGDRLELVSLGTEDVLDIRTDTGSPGIGVYTVGLGGALLAIAGLRSGPD